MRVVSCVSVPVGVVYVRFVGAYRNLDCGLGERGGRNNIKYNGK